MIVSVFEVLSTLVEALLIAWFIPKFLGVSLKKKPPALIILAVQPICQLIFDRFMPGFTLFPMAVVFTCILAFAIALSPKTIWWDALASAAYVISIMLTSTLLFSLFSMFIDNTGDVLQGTDSKIRIIYLIVARLMLFAFCQILLILFRKDKSIEMPNAVLSLTLILSTAVALSALMKMAALDTQRVMNIPILVVVIIVCITNMLLYLLVNQIQKLQKSKYELSLMNERIVLEKKQSENANIIWSNIRKVRHDIKNHLSVIKSALESGDVDACLSYIDDIQQTVESMGDLIRSGNSIIDYLINSKLSGLDGVDVLITGSAGNFGDIKDSDMVCILGNIIDNAVEAQDNVTGVKRIELYFLKMNQNRLIVCKNSVESSVLDKNSELKSTKKDAYMHGFGHQIVETVVKKYGGMVGYFEGGGMFGVQVSIPEPIETEYTQTQTRERSCAAD